MPKRQGYIKKRKGFMGVPHHVVKRQKMGQETEEEAITDPVSVRKLQAGISDPSPTCSNPCAALEGSYLIDGELLAAALGNAHLCPGGRLTIHEDQTKRVGLCSTLVLSCSVCHQEQAFRTSSNVAEGPGQSAEANRRSVLAASENGLGREALSDFCAILGLPPPVADHSFQTHLAHLSSKSTEVCEQQMSEAAQQLRMSAMEEDSSIKEGDVVEVAVSFDGTWHRRGHRSNHGVASVISMDTGEVLDFEVLSKICKECEVRKDWDREGDEYREWWEGHEEECLANHEGSSGMMEVEAAARMWGRSIDKHNLRYKYMVSDGDSKSFNKVREIYGTCENKLVEKLDCVGHVGKRMSNALDKVRKDIEKGEKLSDGKSVGGGKGWLTGTKDTGAIGRLSKFYRNAVRSNSKVVIKDDKVKNKAVEKMQRAVLAVLYHEVKLPDNEVRHQYCPDGEWCEYKNKGSMVDKDHHLDVAFLDLLLPTFKRLSAPDLIERCLPGYTQNQNESLNSLIWKRCPKHLWRGPRVVRIATNLSVLAFNCGAEQSRNRLFQALNLKMSAHTLSSLQRKDSSRLKNAEKRAREVEKKKREASRFRKSREEEMHAEREGVVYESGAF
ncbi:uncharacterized protein LOC121421961 [Lytechinus variegatus]|uniref:uncharacterized protein LOC121421961 n=1 Tax=Lytechinus variegatus TaxID=7654 RepID=UPI001BB1409F|nr:uncharacterized protein LOC121421961 [Lytechinus variegatus]